MADVDSATPLWLLLREHRLVAGEGLLLGCETCRIWFGDMVSEQHAIHLAKVVRPYVAEAIAQRIEAERRALPESLVSYCGTERSQDDCHWALARARDLALEYGSGQ